MVVAGAAVPWRAGRQRGCPVGGHFDDTDA